MKRIKLEATFKKMEKEGWCKDCNGDYISCRTTGLCEAYQDYHNTAYEVINDENT